MRLDSPKTTDAGQSVTGTMKISVEKDASSSPVWLRAIVGTVLEADELVLWTPTSADLSRTELPAARRVRLAGIQTPRACPAQRPESSSVPAPATEAGDRHALLTKDGCEGNGLSPASDDIEQDWAFEAREWSRKSTIGRHVTFSIVGTDGHSEYALVHLDPKESLQSQLLKAGLARLAPNQLGTHASATGPKGLTSLGERSSTVTTTAPATQAPEQRDVGMGSQTAAFCSQRNIVVAQWFAAHVYPALQQDEVAARAHECGIWSKQYPQRHIVAPVTQVKTWLEANIPMGGSFYLKAVVERVLSGSVVLLRVPEPATAPSRESSRQVQRHALILAWLAGLATPSVSSGQTRADSNNTDLGAKGSPEDPKSPAGRIALQARFLTERFLLQRDILVYGKEQTPLGHWIVTVRGVSGSGVDSLHDEQQQQQQQQQETYTLHAQLGEALLRNGLGWMSDWGIDLVSAYAKRWQSLQEDARRRELGWWKFSPATTKAASPLEAPNLTEIGSRWQAEVIQVLSGDSLLLLPSHQRSRATSTTASATSMTTDTSQEPVLHTSSLQSALQVGLAFVRAYPLDTEGGFTAREWLRTRLIGHPGLVRVQVVSQRPARVSSASSTSTGVPQVLLWQADCLLNAALLEAGLVQLKTLPNDQSDAACQQAVNILVEIERKRKQQPPEQQRKQGGGSRAPTRSTLHMSGAGESAVPRGSTTPATILTQPRRIHDVTRREASRRARDLFPILCGSQQSLSDTSERIGIVEYVRSGSRFKVFLNKDALLVSFALAGVRCAVPRPIETEGQRLSAEEDCSWRAYNEARRHVLQRDVRVRILDVDRYGTFLGTLYVLGPSLSQTDPSEQNVVFSGDWAEHLVQAGLATLLERASLPAATWQQLQSAQQRAQRTRRGLWAVSAPSVSADAGKEIGLSRVGAEHSGRAVVWRSLTVTEILPGGLLFLRSPKANPAEAARIQELCDLVARQLVTETAHKPMPHPFDLVLAQYPGERPWYRARVLDTAPGEHDLIFLRFIDSGGELWVDASHLRTLPPHDANVHILEQLPAQTFAFRFDDIAVPDTDEPCWEQSGTLLRELTWDRPLNVVVTKQDPGPAPSIAPELGLVLGDLLVASRPTTQEPRSFHSIDEAGTSVAGLLVQRGLAWCLHPQDEGTRRPAAHRFAAEEQQARHQRSGIWQYSDALRFAALDEEFGL
jgi:endonuclease YncB( thermonuclease family)